MDVNQLPEDVAASIQECWPDGVVAEFEESYFTDLHDALELDLRRIPGATVMWQTQPGGDEWQSYHVFFLAPADTEFQAETEEGAIPGRGWYGCSVCVSTASPIATVDPDEYSQFEDGSETEPDVVTSAYDEDTGEPVDIWEHYQEMLGGEVYGRIDELSAKIAAVLAQHNLWLLQRDILDLQVPELGVDEAVALEPPLTVRDAFFFRGA
jgi:hypothetical protein